MTNNERLNLSYRHELEVLKIVDLANVAAMYHNRSSLPDAVEDEAFFFDIADRQAHPSTEPLQKFLAAIFSEEGDDPELALDRLSASDRNTDLLGVYLQVATPVLNASQFSWGHCRLMWVFGSTYEEAFKVACKWAKDYGHDHE